MAVIGPVVLLHTIYLLKKVQFFRNSVCEKMTATICYWDIRGLAQPIRNSLFVDPKVLRLICFRIWLLAEIMIRYYSTKSAIENCRKNKQTNLVILLIPRFL
jgi:hypothetical protein